MVQPIVRRTLSASEVAAVRSLARHVVQKLPGPLDNQLLRRLAVLGHELPQSIREMFVDFRLNNQPAGGFVISGLPVADLDLGSTPTSASYEPQNAEVLNSTVAMLLAASVLGDPFAHADVRGGRLIVDIVPLPGDENRELASVFL
jgi:hypothetical protein